MSTNNAIATIQSKEVVYTPFGESQELRLTIGMVDSFIATPTKSGQKPSPAEQIKFLMLCKARQLNPFVGDAYLCGYDSRDGPSFSLITAHQALLKRAEACPAYDGMESGVLVMIDGEVVERVGAFRLSKTEVLVGGWARVHRKDRKYPQTARVEFGVYDTGRSRWAKDPAGMITKVAEAHGLRKAFPTQLGGLYCAEEMGTANGHAAPRPPAKLTRSALEDEIVGEFESAPAPEPEAEAEDLPGSFVPPVSQGSPATMDEPPADWEPTPMPADGKLFDDSDPARGVGQ